MLVLCYHAVSPAWSADLSVTTDALRRQLEWLLRRGYRGATFSDAVAASSSRTLAVTFDDAFLSVYARARPILTDLGIPATVFAVTGFADDGRPLRWPGIEHWASSPFDDELVGMSWVQLMELADDGWEIGSHTLTHPRLTQLDDDALLRELRESRTSCERALRRPCRSLAYPYGEVDDRVIAAAAEAGYEAAAALPDRLYAPVPLSWPRVGVYHIDSSLRFRLKASGQVRTFRTRFGL